MHQYQNITQLPIEDSLKVRSYLRNLLTGELDGGKIIFRRANTTNSISKVDSYNRYTRPYYCQSFKTMEEYRCFFPDIDKEMDRHMEIVCEKFNGFTDNKAIREEPSNLFKKRITFHSNSYCQFNPDNLQFNWATTPVVPICGDLLCIFVSNNQQKSKSNTVRADKWFIASEQFLHAWTAIVHDKHDALWRLLPKSTTNNTFEEKLREKLFSGNRLVTNTWLKYNLLAQDEGREFMVKESESFYWHLRVDDISKIWTDMLACLVLMARYGELPILINMPTLGDDNKTRKAWNIDQFLVNTVLENSGCDMKKLEELNISNIPKISEISSDNTSTVKVNIKINSNDSNVNVKVAITKPSQRLTAKDILFSIDWNDGEI